MARIFLLFLVLAITNLSAQVAPEFVYHHWVWEDESTQHSALQLIDDYKAHNIPVGAIIIDSPWETGYNTFDWDTTLFPNAQAMIDSFHSRDVKVIVWVTTAINTDMTELWHYGDSLGYFMKQSAGGGSAVIPWWKGDGSMIDFFNPDAVAWWKSLVDKTLSMGIDGWKCDGTDYSIFLAGATYSPGMGANVTRLQYSHAYYRFFHDYTRQQLGNDRANMSRPVDNYGYTFITDPNLVSFTPRDIGFACWVGDQDATYDGMIAALNNMYQSDVNNYLVVGSDIGGYRDESGIPNGRTKDLFLRWAQLGAFSPLMENGGGGEHRPWMWDAETDAIYNKFTRLHHAMIPYLMHQGDSLFNATQSIMQFLNSTDYQYTLGSDIFVAPITSNSPTVLVNSFPGTNDTWVYLFDNSKTFASGTSNIIDVPLNEYPVFVKSNSRMLQVLDSVVATFTGVSEVAHNTPKVLIYPNPASKEIHIGGLEFNATEQYEFRLFDALGRNLLSAKLNGAVTSVSVQSVDNGVYYYSIKSTTNSSAETITGNLTVQR
ncbi:MAG TPA: TIM-barrel domain-containing protein [Chitinophagales bacterium]|nr:TIM-barrel domain-containing protein [Chitinophagales bacterium]